MTLASTRRMGRCQEPWDTARELFQRGADTADAGTSGKPGGGMVRDPERTVGEIWLLSGGERKQVLEGGRREYPGRVMCRDV